MILYQKNFGGDVMINNKNGTRRPMHSRCMDNQNMKMGLNEFVGLEQPCNNHIDDMKGMPIAMAYVPWQKWQMIYEPKEALKRGTIFKELDLPFEATKGCK